MSLSSFSKKIEVVFHFQIRFYLGSIWLNFTISKKLRSSSIFENIEVVFHNSSSWVDIRLHAKHLCPRLFRTAQIVMSGGVGGVVGVVVVFVLTDNNTTPTKLFYVVLGCWLGCGTSPFHHQISTYTGLDICVYVGV